MPDFAVVLVEPLVEGNVGAVARVMANFGFQDLVLVNARPLGEEAYRRAKHAAPLLDRAQKIDSLQRALTAADLVVGTTGIPTSREKSFHRQALTPEEFASLVAPLEGRVAILLGREDYGLYNEELELVDQLVNIPSSSEYPVLNISHAAAIILYELRKVLEKQPRTRPRRASGFEKERLNQAFDELLTAINYPSHKRLRTKVMFRRFVGRAAPSKWDFYALMGVLRGATKTIQRLLRSAG